MFIKEVIKATFPRKSAASDGKLLHSLRKAFEFRFPLQISYKILLFFFTLLMDCFWSNLSFSVDLKKWRE